jgi:hypothetical protein
MSAQPPVDEQFAAVGLNVADVQAWITLVYEQLRQLAEEEDMDLADQELGERVALLALLAGVHYGRTGRGL